MEPMTVESTPTGPMPAGPAQAGYPCCSGSHRPRFSVGLLLIGLGALLGLSTYGFVDFHPLSQLWLLFLIVPGAGIVFSSRGRRASGLVLVLLGIWFLLRNLGMLPIDARLFPASILLIVGFALIVSSLLSRNGDRRIRPPRSER